MMTTRLVSSPDSFIVEEYTPGYTIDFRQPPGTTDLERRRQSFDFGRFSIPDSEAELAAEVGRSLVDLGVTEDEADLSASLRAYTGELQLGLQLAKCLPLLGVTEIPDDPVESVALLLKKTNCLAKNVHHAVRLYCHIPGDTTYLEEDSTHYGYLLKGECVAKERNRTLPISENSYFCIAGGAAIHGPGQCVVTTRFRYKGITQYGGEVEDWGRLQYIDGCTDTLLVAPPRNGDPCYNALYFPPSTRQTQHVHPSLRCGVIISGEGMCKTPAGDFPLVKGKIFFLPPETYHSFHSCERKAPGKSALAVLAFHPDSDFGPTDNDHPMLNRTYFKFLHRIKSSAKARPAEES